MIDERLPAMRDAAERWGAEGFRAPATQRRWQWMPRLDSTTTRASPTATVRTPARRLLHVVAVFRTQAMVELPITMPRTTPCSRSFSRTTKRSGWTRHASSASARARHCSSTRSRLPRLDRRHRTVPPNPAGPGRRRQRLARAAPRSGGLVAPPRGLDPGLGRDCLARDRPGERRGGCLPGSPIGRARRRSGRAAPPRRGTRRAERGG